MIPKPHALSTWLFDQPDRTTSVAAHEMEMDPHLAGRASDRLAGLRFQVAEIAAYTHATEYWAERVQMMQAWSDHLDELR